ncbi:hypothetical protein [Vibrio sp. JZG120]
MLRYFARWRGSCMPGEVVLLIQIDGNRLPFKRQYLDEEMADY